ncbi:MAG: lipopolysaccharide core heptose(I) kinase RfaP [Sedimentisphaerales bacterium]|nr:lipopolysaccharide core heptose(I) kinase RfaP [Sedimentisphaerales bacterium]
MALHLSEKFASLWGHLDVFAQVEALRGEVLREVKARRTLRFTLNGDAYFLKVHRGVGWTEIFKELLQFKRPVVGAENEWKALNLLRRIGVETMTPAAYGASGVNPAQRRSFIITEELRNTESLGDFCRDWALRTPPFQLRVALIERVAAMVRQMHQHGMNHRDCYICHFHLDVSAGRDRIDPRHLHLYVIDLHRAQIRRRVPARWIVKDLAGLYFSAMGISLTRSDCLRFMATYEQRSPRAVLQDRRWFWRRVARTAVALYRKHFGRMPRVTHGIP